MKKPKAPYIGFTCDCGHDYDVSIEDAEFENFVAVCPSCGIEEKLTIDEIADIVMKN